MVGDLSQVAALLFFIYTGDSVKARSQLAEGELDHRRSPSASNLAISNKALDLSFVQSKIISFSR